MANDRQDTEGRGASPDGDSGAGPDPAAGNSPTPTPATPQWSVPAAAAPDGTTLRARIAGHALRNEKTPPPGPWQPPQWQQPGQWQQPAPWSQQSPWQQPGSWQQQSPWQPPAYGWQQPAPWQPPAQQPRQWQQQPPGPSTSVATSWPVGQVPWGYSNPPLLPPVLEAPAVFHPPISRRPALSLSGRESPRRYALGIGLGLPGIALVLLYMIGVAAGFRLPSGPVPPWILLETVSLVAATGLVLWCVAQARQRQADGWRDYNGPAPLLVAGAFISLTLAAEVLLALGLRAADVDFESPAVTLLQLLVYLATYFGLVHFLAVRTGALTWHDIAAPQHLAPSSDDWEGSEPAAGWTRSWGATAGAIKRRVGGRNRFGDVLIGLALVLPLMIAANLLSAGMLFVLGLHPEDISPDKTIVSDGLSMLIVFVTVAILAPIGEEVFFRGFVTNAWARSLSHNSAILRASLFFAFVHIMNTASTDASVSWRVAVFNFGARVPVAFALTWVYMRRRSILASGTLHAGYNGLITIIGFM